MSNPVTKEILEQLLRHESLTSEEAESLMETLFSGSLSSTQIGAVLIALRMKRETPEEVAGFARAMRRHALPVPTTKYPLVDTCGTGGDACKTFNISTCAALVAAGAGANVAKHGNRSITSKCGSADVLEALGVNLSLSPDAVGQCVDKIGIGFLFARNHHPAMKVVAPIRAELGVRTIFNLLGPLTNPAGATRQVIGVYSRELCFLVADTLRILGAEHALVVHGEGGLDEIALWERTWYAELANGRITESWWTPNLLGLTEAQPDSVSPGQDAPENAAILRGVLSGEDRTARREIVLANAGAAIYVAGLAASIKEGIVVAAKTIDAGAAIAKLDALIAFTNREREQS